MKPAGTPGPTRRPVGRPAHIDRTMIAKAAHAVGLSNLTLRAVADRLGVSVAGLYHHIDSKDELIRLAAEYVSRRVPMPVDHGQHWALWLREWGWYIHTSFASEPELIRQFLEGAISSATVAENLDATLTPMVRQGFRADEALAAYELVTKCALGSAILAIRERLSTTDRRTEYEEIVAQRPDDELVHIRALLHCAVVDSDVGFDDELDAITLGIAARRGDDLTEFVRRLAKR